MWILLRDEELGSVSEGCGRGSNREASCEVRTKAERRKFLCSAEGAFVGLTGGALSSVPFRPERVGEGPRRLATPGVDDQLLELVAIDRRQPDEDGGKPVVVRLGEELLLIGGDDRLLVGLILLRTKKRKKPSGSAVSGSASAIRRTSSWSSTCGSIARCRSRTRWPFPTRSHRRR